MQASAASSLNADLRMFSEGDHRLMVTFDKHVGDSGVTLNGGQKAGVALARAVDQVLNLLFTSSNLVVHFFDASAGMYLHSVRVAASISLALLSLKIAMPIDRLGLYHFVALSFTQTHNSFRIILLRRFCCVLSSSFSFGLLPYSVKICHIQSAFFFSFPFVSLSLSLSCVRPLMFQT